MSPDSNDKRRALIVGASGISGQAAATHFRDAGWQTFGLTRSQPAPEGVTAVHGDLLDPASLSGLAEIDPDVVVFTAWVMRGTEAENIEANSAILRNLLDALGPSPSLRHVALMTGLKHYLGPFEDYGRVTTTDTPFHEDAPRLATPNFYYAQEDVLFEAAARRGFTWSVHRAHTVFGYATGNAMNMVLTLGTYAAMCRELGEPFIFPGSEMQWNGITDVTDADLMAEQFVWASTSPEGENQAFNITTGEVFRWRWLWPRLAEFFGLEWEGYAEQPRPLQARMGDAPAVWRRIAEREDLVEADIDRLASWWHTDGDMGRPIECFTDMTKSRLAGFLGYRSTELSFQDIIRRYREAGYLPTW